MPQDQDRDRNHLCGVVLAGGRSTRLGRDKARVLVQGRTLLQKMLDLAGEFCSRTFVVGRNPGLHGLKAEWMLDKTPGIGPMGGIITALENLDKPCLVLACDLPLMKRDIIARLVLERSSRGPGKCMTTYLQKETGYIESLVSIYEPSCRDLLLASLKQGCYKLSQAIPPELRRHIPYGADQREFFFNVNYPHDLEKLNITDD
ncbi:molybdenum cofactor guanylyltransferase [Desulfonatronovibrio hydrogenovorans]|uniref:molybdenum cofactor guanylyltransferase n=1 Tax=Desulfonatronovibrio hydrogenovorans TaxID=53245 RepID=UPI000550F6FF|nr:molybdenum cofactor guanylyltransferase [Desulfonatronovibrio hydrogenovorans]